jgi:hypothetical protein
MIPANSDRVQHLGYLAWAASEKDPGYGPAMLLREGKRSARYSSVEVAQLAFDGPAPDAADLSQRWAKMLGEAEAIIDLLPPGDVGKAVLDRDGGLFQGGAEDLAAAVDAGQLLFHPGSIRGAMPRFVR